MTGVICRQVVGYVDPNLNSSYTDPGLAVSLDLVNLSSKSQTKLVRMSELTIDRMERQQPMTSNNISIPHLGDVRQALVSEFFVRSW